MLLRGRFVWCCPPTRALACVCMCVRVCLCVCMCVRVCTYTTGTGLLPAVAVMQQLRKSARIMQGWPQQQGQPVLLDRISLHERRAGQEARTPVASLQRTPSVPNQASLLPAAQAHLLLLSNAVHMCAHVFQVHTTPHVFWVHTAAHVFWVHTTAAHAQPCWRFPPPADDRVSLSWSPCPRHTTGAFSLSPRRALAPTLQIRLRPVFCSCWALAPQSATVAELDLHKAIHQIEAKLEAPRPQQLAAWQQQQRQQQQRQRQRQRQWHMGQMPFDHSGLGPSSRYGGLGLYARCAHCVSE